MKANTTGYGIEVFDRRIPSPDGRRCLWVRSNDPVTATAVNRFRREIDSFRDLPIETFDEEAHEIADLLGDGYAFYADGSGYGDLIRFYPLAASPNQEGERE